MVADNWMKKNPFLSLLLGCVLTLLSSFAVLKADWVRSDDKAIIDAISKKADLDYVDKQNLKQDFTISCKADKSLVESMDKKLDLILSKLPNK